MSLISAMLNFEVVQFFVLFCRISLIEIRNCAIFKVPFEIKYAYIAQQ